jgi:hypothetical protein
MQVLLCKYGYFYANAGTFCYNVTLALMSLGQAPSQLRDQVTQSQAQCHDWSRAPREHRKDKSGLRRLPPPPSSPGHSHPQLFFRPTQNSTAHFCFLGDFT